MTNLFEKEEGTPYKVLRETSTPNTLSSTGSKPKIDGSSISSGTISLNRMTS